MLTNNTYRITVQGGDACFFCGENEMVLAAMIHAGCGPIHHGCFGGGCGVCKMRVVSGQYAIVKRMSRTYVTKQEQSEGYVLICCIQPRSDLTVAKELTEEQ